MADHPRTLAEDIRNEIISDLDYVLDSAGRILVEAEGLFDRFENVCSEGCQGVDPVDGAPGFVIQLKESRRRFHVTVREIEEPSDG